VIGQTFLFMWAFVAVGLGTNFAFRPDWVIKAYRRNLELYPLPKKSKARMMDLPPYTKLMFRIGGFVFIIAGVTVGTLAALGVIRVE
jgi:hypothetical protein